MYIQVIKSNQSFFFSLQYHRKIVRLWEKYDCFTNSAKQKQIQSSHHGCPKSQSFYTPPANAMSNLVQVTHNPDTNLTTTNVASPQTPKTHTLSTEASRVRNFKVYVPNWLGNFHLWFPNHNTQNGYVSF